MSSRGQWICVWVFLVVAVLCLDAVGQVDFDSPVWRSRDAWFGSALNGPVGGGYPSNFRIRFTFNPGSNPFISVRFMESSFQTGDVWDDAVSNIDVFPSDTELRQSVRDFWCGSDQATRDSMTDNVYGMLKVNVYLSNGRKIPIDLSSLWKTNVLGCYDISRGCTSFDCAEWAGVTIPGELTDDEVQLDYYPPVSEGGNVFNGFASGGVPLDMGTMSPVGDTRVSNELKVPDGVAPVLEAYGAMGVDELAGGGFVLSRPQGRRLKWATGVSDAAFWVRNWWTLGSDCEEMTSGFEVWDGEKWTRSHIYVDGVELQWVNNVAGFLNGAIRDVLEQAGHVLDGSVLWEVGFGNESEMCRYLPGGGRFGMEAYEEDLNNYGGIAGSFNVEEDLGGGGGLSGVEMANAVAQGLEIGAQNLADKIGEAVEGGASASEIAGAIGDELGLEGGGETIGENIAGALGLEGGGETIGENIQKAFEAGNVSHEFGGVTSDGGLGAGLSADGLALRDAIVGFMGLGLLPVDSSFEQYVFTIPVPWVGGGSEDFEIRMTPDVTTSVGAALDVFRQLLRTLIALCLVWKTLFSFVDVYRELS